jgi:hypothetical protein
LLCSEQWQCSWKWIAKAKSSTMCKKRGLSLLMCAGILSQSQRSTFTVENTSCWLLECKCRWGFGRTTGNGLCLIEIHQPVFFSLLIHWSLPFFLPFACFILFMKVECSWSRRLSSLLELSLFKNVRVDEASRSCTGEVCSDSSKWSPKLKKSLSFFLESREA